MKIKFNKAQMLVRSVSRFIKPYTYHLVIFAFVICAGSSVSAAEYTFQNAGGDLADAANWAGGILPGKGVTGLIPTKSKGYTISKDVTFGNLYFNGPGPYKVTASSGVCVTILTNSCPLRIVDGNSAREVTFSGGIYDMGGADWKGGGSNGFTYLTDSCVFRNIGTCSTTALQYQYARLQIRGASKIYCSEFKLAPSDPGNGLLQISEGGLLESDGNFYTDINDSSFAKSRTIVKDEGSVLRCGTMRVGHASGSNSVQVLDGVAIECRRLRIGNGNKVGNRIVLSNGSLKVDESLEVKFSSLIGNRNGIVATNSVIEVGGGFTNVSPHSYFDFQNVKFTVGVSCLLFGERSGSVMRFGGANGTLPAPIKEMGNYFSSSSKGNSLIIDDGFVFESNVDMKSMMDHSSNDLIRVSNNAKFSTLKTLQIGNSTASIDNMFEISSGGIVEAGVFNLMGVGNRLVISNGTLRSSVDLGDIRVGYNPRQKTKGSKVVLKGANPRIDADGAFGMGSDNSTRFELPPSGYAADFSPVTASTLDFSDTASIEVDYEDFLAAGGGDVTLMTFSENVSETISDSSTITFREWIAHQDEAMQLPPRCRLHLKLKDGKTMVVFSAYPPLGSRIVIR